MLWDNDHSISIELAQHSSHRMLYVTIKKRKKLTSSVCKSKSAPAFNSMLIISSFLVFVARISGVIPYCGGGDGGIVNY